LIKVILEEAGAAVTLAENGLVGVEIAREKEFHAILMDMQMPVMDGYTATGKLREMGLTIPIIGLTAHAMAGDEEKCLSAGCCGYLTKPVEAEKILRYLATRLIETHPSSVPRNLAHSVGSDPLSAEPEEVGSPAERAGGGEDRARSTLPIEKPIYAEIVIEFVEYVQNMLGQIAGHIERDEFREVSTLAHSLKGSGGTAGFEAFTTPAKSLELSAKSENKSECSEVLAALSMLVDRIEVPLLADSAVPQEGR
jgi:CheY-like chemotaxis protein/HPt (histidine-containing phosphotransfer) domain-containing protein